MKVHVVAKPSSSLYWLAADNTELNSGLNGSPPVGRRRMSTLIAIAAKCLAMRGFRFFDRRDQQLVLRAPASRG
jgi:hypothetical protein